MGGGRRAGSPRRRSAGRTARVRGGGPHVPEPGRRRPRVRAARAGGRRAAGGGGCAGAGGPGARGRRAALAGEAHPDGAAVRFGSDRLEADAVVWACGAWLGHCSRTSCICASRSSSSRCSTCRPSGAGRVGRLRRRLLRPRPRGAARHEGRGRPRRCRGGPGRAAARGHAGGGRAGARVRGPPLPRARLGAGVRNARLPLRAHGGRRVPVRPPPGAPGRLAPRRRVRARLQARAGAGRARGGRARRPGEPEPRFALGRAHPSRSLRTAGAG